MKIALLIPCYNRANYLRECLEYFERADLSKVEYICLLNDASADPEIENIFCDGNRFNGKAWVHNNYVNEGVVKTLYQGYEYLFQSHDLVINLDSDALVRNDFIDRLIENYIPNTLLTGFHSTTMNRHTILEETEYFYIKKSVGGINFCIDKAAYENYVKPALEETMNGGNWDHRASIRAGQVYSLKQSVIQHIGFESTLGHHDNPDVADTFIPINLPNVTLIGVDSNEERLQIAIDKCKENIQFAAVVNLTLDIRSKEQYSEFCIKELYKYVNTEYLLICQYDGFVHNWKAWDNRYLDYDYIGAPWYYNDGMSVGNGGFSLRSRRLMEVLATDETITILHPEDHHICRTYRPYLEQKYGIKFAPIELAEKFSFEGYRQPDKFLDKQFGRHGNNLRTQAVSKVNKRYVVNQFLSLGDILFLIPMIRELMAEGNTMLWPIDDRYFDISKHFPDVPFVKKSDYPDLPYDNMQMVQTEHGQMLPYRFAIEIMGRPLNKCMDSKYELYRHDYKIWRGLYWKRDYEKEGELITLLDLPENFILVNRTFGHEAKFVIEPVINSDLPIVEMTNMPGFTLIDWLWVIEKASEIHMSNSSLNYLLELLPIKVPTHIYKRNLWGEIGFSYTRHLFHNPNFIYHE